MGSSLSLREMSGTAGHRWASFGLIMALVGTLVIGWGARPASAETCQPFPDVGASNQHCRNIAWLKDQRITKPRGGLFDPASAVNRGSMAAFLYRFSHPQAPAPVCAEPPFPDVPPSHLFCGYIQWAADNGIAFGYPDGTYRAQRPVTRGAMAAFLYRIVNTGTPAQKCATQPFFDVETTDVFCGVISWMRARGLTFGVDNGVHYDTKGDVSRQAMASFLHRLDGMMGYGPGSVCRPHAATMRAARTVVSRYALGPVTDHTAQIANLVGPKFGITTIYGWRAPASEKYDPNGHPAGLALDFMINNVADGEDVGQRLAEYLQRNQTWIGVKYVIYRQHIWLAGRPFDQWREMEDRGSPTQNHMDHVHLSLRRADTGGGACRS